MLSGSPSPTSACCTRQPRRRTRVPNPRLHGERRSLCDGPDGCDSRGGASRPAKHLPCARLTSLAQVSKPFFDSLQRWIFHGELHDPYNEFFVCLNPEFADKHFVRRDPFLGAEDAGFSGFDGRSRDLEGVESHLLWEHKFAFRKEMLPSFVSEDFGRKVREASLSFLNAQPSPDAELSFFWTDLLHRQEPQFHPL